MLPLAFALIPVLIVDGQNNHKWQETTPVLKRLLEETKLFRVDVATTPAKGGDWSQFKPDFDKYKVVLSNYNGEDWPKETLGALLRYVRAGGGFVSYHAADNAFPESPEFNEMIGLGGWGERTERHGPKTRWEGSALVLDPSPGRGGHHGDRHAFKLITRNSQHPIMKGLPGEWMHTVDELYDSLRGPAKNITVLATAFSDPATKGTGHHEPMLMTLAFGKGRVFHTVLGHDVDAMRSVGFIVTLQRGVEWAATGRVTQKAPPDFPGADKVSLR